MIKEPWTEFRKCEDRRQIPVDICTKTPGEETCTALIFWYAL